MHAVVSMRVQMRPINLGCAPRDRESGLPTLICRTSPREVGRDGQNDLHPQSLLTLIFGQ